MAGTAEIPISGNIAISCYRTPTATIRVVNRHTLPHFKKHVLIPFNVLFLDGVLSVKRKIVISIFLNNTLGEIATAIKKVNVKPVGTVRAILHECFTIIKIGCR